MTEFPTGLILANCFFKGFFRRSGSVCSASPLGRAVGDPYFVRPLTYPIQ